MHVLKKYSHEFSISRKRHDSSIQKSSQISKNQRYGFISWLEHLVRAQQNEKSSMKKWRENLISEILLSNLTSSNDSSNDMSEKDILSLQISLHDLPEASQKESRIKKKSEPRKLRCAPISIRWTDTRWVSFECENDIRHSDVLIVSTEKIADPWSSMLFHLLSWWATCMTILVQTLRSDFTLKQSEKISDQPMHSRLGMIKILRKHIKVWYGRLHMRYSVENLGVISSRIYER